MLTDELRKYFSGKIQILKLNKQNIHNIHNENIIL